MNYYQLTRLSNGFCVQDNVFTAAITFGDLGIKTKADADEKVTIDTVDVSEVSSGGTTFTGNVIITGDLYIDQDDTPVTKMDFGAFTDEVMDKTHLANLFLYKVPHVFYYKNY